jgi:S-adenosylmethionine/arginine decarboxylase-like enzyme
MNEFAWGETLTIDLGECDSDIIRNGNLIKEFIETLIKKIGMKQYGNVLLERFALHDSKVAGYSAMVFLETSSITSHYAEESNSAYIDIFSCSNIPRREAIEYSIEFYKAKFMRSNFQIRYIPNKVTGFDLKAMI